MPRETGAEGLAAADGALAARAADGDPAALAALVERHYGRILRLGNRLLGDRAEAEDLAQDVSITLGRRIRSFRGDAAFSTWLYRVVVNAARDRMRAAGRRRRLAEAWSEADLLTRAGAEVRDAEAAWLRGALDGLAPPLRETVVLVLDEGLTHAEAARVLGIGEGTVSWRLSEARKVLRAMARAAEERT